MTTTNTNPPAAARNRLSSVIWEDGSSFDYENGYSSNGAILDKNRSKPVRYTAQTRANNAKYFGSWLLLLGAALIFGLTIAATFFSMSESSKAAQNADRNNAAIKEYLVKHEGLYIIKMNGENQHFLTNKVIVQDKTGNVYKCDVEAADNDFRASAFLFCGGSQSKVNINLPEKVEYHSIFSQK